MKAPKASASAVSKYLGAAPERFKKSGDYGRHSGYEVTTYSDGVVEVRAHGGGASSLGSDRAAGCKDMLLAYAARLRERWSVEVHEDGYLLVRERRA